MLGLSHVLAKGVKRQMRDISSMNRGKGLGAQKGATYLGLSVKGGAIKGLIFCSSWDL